MRGDAAPVGVGQVFRLERPSKHRFRIGTFPLSVEDIGQEQRRVPVTGAASEQIFECPRGARPVPGAVVTPN